MIRSYKDLSVWQESRKLSVEIYTATRHFPQSELFGLTNQMRRAAVSISSNIAEGCGRQTDKDTIRFLYQAKGSLFELETQCIIAQDLSFLTKETHQNISIQLERCIQLLEGFIRYYRNKETRPPNNKQRTTDN
jgi:four helix bundle protein